MASRVGLKGSVRVANWITLSRLVFGVLFAIVFHADQTVARAWLLVLVILVETSDLLDGWVARHLGETSDDGAALDGMADIFSHIPIYVCLLSVGLVPTWLVITVFWTGVSMSTIRILAAVHGEGYVHARITGKVRGVVDGAAAISITLVHTGLSGADAADTAILTIVLVTAVTLIHLVTAVDYYAHNRRTLLKLFC